MFCSTFFRTLLGVGAAIVMLFPAPAEAQIVRRYAGGGVAVRAPFVRVDVGPYGETSVRAPFVAVDDPGGVYVGPRRRWMRRPLYAAPPEGAAPYYGQPGAAPLQQPAPAEFRPLPTSEELAVLDVPTLLQVLRDLSATLQYELQRFDKADGWQRYLALSDDALGNPGAEQVAIRLDVLQKQLARFEKVAAGGQFAKIAALPSFAPTHEALRLVVERFSEGGPAMVPPSDDDYSHDPGPVTERGESELLPAPPPSPEPRRGERSILKPR
jgi:hypothetical protein